MEVLAALFIDTFGTRSAEGGATRIDLTGIHFSIAAPSPVPVRMEPHLFALIHCRPDESGQGVFEVCFREGYEEDSPQLARNVSPFTVEPGKLTYRLVRGELEFDSYRQVVAHCRVDRLPWIKVPYTLLQPPQS
jgi:hypothetical protein